MDLPRTPAIYRSSTRRSNVVLGGFLKHAGTRRKHAETAIEPSIAGIAGSKVTNQWGIKGFLYRGSGNSVSNYLISLRRWAAVGEPPFRAAFFDTKSCTSRAGNRWCGTGSWCGYCTYPGRTERQK